jgi:signal transduction histidine kinase
LLPNYQATLLGASREFEMHHGSMICSVFTRPLYDSEGKISGFISIIIDKTNEVHTQMRIMKAIVEGQDLERKRISDEIHDSIGQLLSAINLQARHVKSQAGKNGSEADFNALLELITHTIDEVRQVSHRISPMMLYDFDLETSLRELVRQLTAGTETTIKLELPDHPYQMNKQSEIGLYRITQELANNAIKYAHASVIQIALRVNGNRLSLQVDDDGIGFIRSQHRSKGIGLHNVEMRARSLHGKFSLHSKPGLGTSALIDIPLQTPVEQLTTTTNATN